MFNNDRVKFHHGHDHDHDNNGDCDNKHTHSHGDVVENKDEKTLKILLLHWVNHNESHEEGFREWVDKARAIGKEDTADSIEKAIEYMKKANEMLIEAKKHM